MPVPKFVCGVACASGFASSMDGGVSWDRRSIVWKARVAVLLIGILLFRKYGRT
jgi:hypothetical protein